MSESQLRRQWGAAILLPFVTAAALALALGPRGEAADAPPATVEAAISPADEAFFQEKVLPILQDNCFQCHGGERIRANLILTRREGVLKGGDHGPAVSLDNPDESLLLAMISYKDDRHQMPPSGKLANDQIAILTQWVHRGAPWPAELDFTTAQPEQEVDLFEQAQGFWAFQPVKRPPTPTVENRDWPTNPIDAFILARLESEGLHPAPEADRITLVRRAYYDLLGLPPTPQQVDAFVNDTRPDAWERLVDELLASPHYGEKWGRFWLDLVRYAETNSYERDNPKPHAWRYRDYVIRSFNANKPYDRFIIEQLAGDELPDATADTYIATGFYRLGIWDDEPVDREQAFYDGLDDIVTTTGEVFLGMTVGCARCHDHKIDPLRQRDYYSLLAFFRNINHFRNGGPTDERMIFESEAARAEYEKREAERVQRLNQTQQELIAIENRFRMLASDSELPQKDLDDLHYRFYRDTWDALPDFDTLKPEDTGRIENNLFDIRLRTRDEAFGFVFEGDLIVPADGQYEFFLHAADGARLLVAGKEVIRHESNNNIRQQVTGTIDLRAGRVPIRLEYYQRLDEFGLKLAWAGPGVKKRLLSAPDDAHADKQLGKAPELNKDVAALILGDTGKALLGEHVVREYDSLRKRLEALKRPTRAEHALVVTEAGRDAPDTFVLIRGNASAPGDKVTPGFPAIFNLPEPTLPTPPENATTTLRRSVLARWIASPDNPLTARVMVNRLWQQHFGRGIVATPSDFGLGGERPSHPELLDWLASEFVDSGWNIKHMHRLMMTSSTYRMAGTTNPEALAKDPTNRLLWRYSMRRITGEELRDSILAVSGKLNLKMFGPSVYPPIPREVMQGQSEPGKGWPTSPPQEASRRSVYVHVKRSLRLPILESYDAPESDFSCPVRLVTTQPTQALGMLNGTFLNEQAEHLAERLRREAGENMRDRVALALQLVTCRKPTETQIARGVELIEGLQKDGATPEQALKYFCLVTLNLNAFVYVD